MKKLLFFGLLVLLLTFWGTAMAFAATARGPTQGTIDTVIDQNAPNTLPAALTGDQMNYAANTAWTGIEHNPVTTTNPADKSGGQLLTYGYGFDNRLSSDDAYYYAVLRSATNNFGVLNRTHQLHLEWIANSAETLRAEFSDQLAEMNETVDTTTVDVGVTAQPPISARTVSYAVD